MAPIVLISVLFGTGWGVFSSFVYALIQIGLDIAGMMAWGMDARMWIGAMVFDYIVAYTVIGIAGCFRNKGTWGVCLGTALALVLRFISHFISGYIFFDIWMPESFSHPAVYSVVYNGTYMLPELITTVFAIFILYKTSTVKRMQDILNQQ
jgi:thiamine transporter